ncbi:MAG TPA: P-II family nitrogen regulator [Bacillota bacterium]|nr:P-II family nitrogen regulator [Bacillota bacterium]
MKEVMAIIRMNMMNKTKQALSEADISSFSATGRVMGRGKGKVDIQLLQGVEEGYDEAISQLGKGSRLLPKRLIMVTVPDPLVEKVVQTIIETNQTGQPGDGKIFVLPVLDAVRVRTGESGDGVLDE